MADDKVQEIMEQLEKGIKDTLNSEKYMHFLKVQSQFYNYSFNNQLLIYLQKPDASSVAGFQTWQNKFERHVLRGEKGISILAPSPYKYQREVEIVNPETGQKEMQTRTVEGLGFRKVTVFDVSQTDGKPLPTICNELQGNSIYADTIIKAIKQISEIPIKFRHIESGAKGTYNRLDNVITINEGMSKDQTAKTLVHEYTHGKIHGKQELALMDRSTKEVQAESVAYIVSNRFGLDTSQYSFEYVANWSSGMDLKELKASLSIIQKTASEIIEKMEKVLSRDFILQNSPVKVQIQWSESNRLYEEVGKILNIDFAKTGFRPDNPIILTFNEANSVFEKVDQEIREAKTVNGEYKVENPINGPGGHLYVKTQFNIILEDGRIQEGRFDFGDGAYKNLYECAKRECAIDVERYIKEHEAKSYDSLQQAQKNAQYAFEHNKLVLDNVLGYNGIGYIVSSPGEPVQSIILHVDGKRDLQILNNTPAKDVIPHLKEWGLQNTQIHQIINAAKGYVNNDVSIHSKVVELYKQECPSIRHISENSAKVIDSLNREKGTCLTIKEFKDMYKEAGKKIEASYTKSDMEEFKAIRDVVDDLKHAQLMEKQQTVQDSKAMGFKANEIKAMEISQ